MPNDTPPDLEFIASQLRKPTGQPARQFADSMDIANEVLYDLTLETMKVQPGQKLLEIGFGSGSFIHKLFAAAADIHLQGLDFSPDMVELAASKNQELVANGKLQLRHGESSQMPFSDSEFDKVFCNMVIFFWETPANDLKEVKRVLKAGGKFYTGFRTKQTMEVMPFTKYGFHLYEPEEWQSVLEQNGFKVTNVVKKTDPVPVPAGTAPIKLESVVIEAEKAS